LIGPLGGTCTPGFCEEAFATNKTDTGSSWSGRVISFSIPSTVINFGSTTLQTNSSSGSVGLLFDVIGSDTVYFQAVTVPTIIIGPPPPGGGCPSTTVCENKPEMIDLGVFAHGGNPANREVINLGMNSQAGAPATYDPLNLFVCIYSGGLNGTIVSGCVGAGLPVNVTINSNPNTITNQFFIDGTPYSGSQTFSWLVGSVHNVTARQSALSGALTIYTFQSWSQGGTRSQNFTVPPISSTLTANYMAVSDSCSLYTDVFQLLLNRCIVGVWYFTFAGVLGNFGAGISVAAIAVAIYQKNDNPTLAIFWTMIASGVLGVMLPVAFAPIAGMLFILAIAGSVFQATRSRPKE